MAARRFSRADRKELTRPRGGTLAANRRACTGHVRLRRPLPCDDRSRRIVSVAGLSIPGSQVRVAKLAQSGCDLGLQPRLCRCSIACDDPGGPALSRVALGPTLWLGTDIETRGSLRAEAWKRSERRSHAGSIGSVSV